MLRMRLALIALLLLKLTAPAKAQDSDYPRREVDRPYGLPSDLREFRFGAGILFGNQNSGSSTGQLGVAPILQYESGHSERFAWFFNPLPLGFKYSPIFAEHHRVGLKAYYEFFAYGVSLNYRLRLGSFAIELEGTLDEMNVFFVKSKTAEVVVRPIFQVTDEVALILSGTYGRYSSGSDFVNAIFSDFAEDPNDPGWVVANGLSGGGEIQWSLSPRFDLRGGAAANHFFSGGDESNAISATLYMKLRF